MTGLYILVDASLTCLGNSFHISEIVRQSYTDSTYQAFISCISALQVGLKSLNLGICPKLNVLHIEASQMVSLELKGCGILSEASINCPLLTSLDASFCRCNLSPIFFCGPIIFSGHF